MGRVLISLVVVIVIAVGGFFAWSHFASQGAPADALEAQYMTRNDRFVDVEGLAVRVRERGPEDGPVVMLVHGFSFSLESFDGWASRLADTYRVVQYDLAGHGLTGPDPDQRYSIPERTQFHGAVMDALDIETASLAGNSLGGGVAWRYAAQAPNRVDSLILISAAAYPFNNVADTAQAPNAGERIFFTSAPQAMVDATANLLFVNAAALPEGRVQLMGDMMRREGNGQAFLDHIAEFTLPDPTSELARVLAPTLVLWGAEDGFMSVAEHAERLTAALPNATLQVVDGAGHVAHEDKPDETAALARVFLETNIIETTTP